MLSAISVSRLVSGDSAAKPTVFRNKNLLNRIQTAQLSVLCRVCCQSRGSWECFAEGFNESLVVFAV